MTKLADGTIKITTEIDENGFKKGLSNIENQSKATFNRVASGVTSIAATSVKAVTGLIATATGGFTAIAGATAKIGADFELQMDKVGAVSGASAEQMEVLEAKAKEMGATSQFSATESAEALEYMALAGWNTEDMVSGLSGVMNLAAASGEDLGLVSDIVTDGLTAFGMSAKDSAKFADVLAATSSNANTNVSMLGESFKYAAPVAGALGYSIEDTSLALGLMANAGIKASSSGTALRTMMANLASPSNTVSAAIADLGLSLTDASGNMLPFNDVIMQLRESFSELGEAEKAQYAEMIAGKEGMSGLLAIVNATDADLNKLSDSINNSNGSAEQMAETMNDNLAGAIKIFKSALEGISLSLYDELQTPLKEVVQYATEMANGLQSAFNEGGIDGLVAEIGNSIGKLLTDISKKAPEMLKIGIDIIQSLLTGIGSNSSAIGESAATILTTLANGIMTLLPTFITVGAELLVSFTNGIINDLPSILETGKEMLISLADGITKNLPALVDNAIEIITSLAEFLVDNLELILNTGIDIILALVDGLVKALPDLIPACVDAILIIVEALIDNLDEIIEAALDIILALADGLIEALPRLIEKVPVIIDKLVTALTQPQMITKLLMAGVDLVLALIKGLISMLESLAKAALELGKTIINTIKELPEKLKTIGKDIVKGLWNGVKSMGSWLGDKLKGWAAGIVDSVKGFFGIHSPSRLFRDEIGKQLVQGAVIGAKSEKDDLVDALISPYDEFYNELDKRENTFEVNFTSNLDELEKFKDKIDDVDFIDKLKEKLPELNSIVLGNIRAMTPAGSVNNTNTHNIKNVTNNQGDFVIKIDKFNSNKPSDISTLLTQASFYQKQRAQALGGI